MKRQLLNLAFGFPTATTIHHFCSQTFRIGLSCLQLKKSFDAAPRDQSAAGGSPAGQPLAPKQPFRAIWRAGKRPFPVPFPLLMIIIGTPSYRRVFFLGLVAARKMFRHRHFIGRGALGGTNASDLS